ncbi:hypothetical protein BC826DRAFT_1046026 [Russula brevipes]|nr:hypothetical protein BC826DRAFT_1046026 [Russula brevipes]
MSPLIVLLFIACCCLSFVPPPAPLATRASSLAAATCHRGFQFNRARQQRVVLFLILSAGATCHPDMASPCLHLALPATSCLPSSPPPCLCFCNVPSILTPFSYLLLQSNAKLTGIPVIGSYISLGISTVLQRWGQRNISASGESEIDRRVNP